MSAASNQSPEMADRLFGAQQQTSNVFPHRTRHTANKTSFPAPGSKALKPSFNIKYTFKPKPIPQHVSCAYVELQQAQECSAVTGGLCTE